MKKRIFTMLLAVAFVGGGFWLLKTLPLGLSSNAYATPDKGKTCSRCHGPNAKNTPKELRGYTNQFMTEKCGDFSSEGTNPYFVLTPGFQLVLEGKEKKQNIHLTITVLDETKTFTKLDLGAGVVKDVVTRIVREEEKVDGVLAEVSLNYFAICDRTNSVFYFGEDVDIYDETGTNVIDHSGTWHAGGNGTRAGIVMPGVILLGGKYFQEVAPGVALDRAEILSMTEAIQTPAGTFNNCLKTKETSALERGKEYKFYAPGIGLIKSGTLELTQYGDVTVP
jgi:hypothetical protein